MRPLRCCSFAAFVTASFLISGCTPGPESSPVVPAKTDGAGPTQPVKSEGSGTTQPPKADDSGPAPAAKTGEGH